jgi:hypothetical protein
MDVQELEGLIPRMLEVNFPGRYRRTSVGSLPEGMADPGGWLVETDDLYCFMTAATGGPGFLWIKCGVAHAIPRNSDLAFLVAARNKDLMAGRAYMTSGPEIGMVVVDETVFAPSLSLDHGPSIQDLANRIGVVTDSARQLRADVLGQFGGRPFGGEDWMMLSLG